MRITLVFQKPELFDGLYVPFDKESFKIEYSQDCRTFQISIAQILLKTYTILK